MHVLFLTLQGHEFVGRLTKDNVKGGAAPDQLPKFLDISGAQTGRGEAIDEATGCVGRRFYLDKSTRNELLPVYRESAEG